MKPKYIWFDLGYTLVYTKREEYLHTAFQQLNTNRTLQDITLAFHLADKYFMRAVKGFFSQPEEDFLPVYFNDLCFRLDFDGDSSKLMEIYIKIRNANPTQWYPYPFSGTVLSKIKSKNIGIGLISNWDISARKVLIDCQLMEYFDTIIISSEVGLMKPQQKIFELATRKINLSPSNCLFVGDNYYDDIIGSESVNMPSLLINPYGMQGIEEINGVNIISNIREIITMFT